MFLAPHVFPKFVGFFFGGGGGVRDKEQKCKIFLVLLVTLVNSLISVVLFLLFSRLVHFNNLVKSNNYIKAHLIKIPELFTL